MKKKINLKKLLGTRRIILCLTALLLVTLIALGSTVSWIEEVSQVEFDNQSGQQTPAKIGDKILKSDIITRQKTGEESGEISTIKLNDYFNESGDIHLSPCYGDGDNFYFPINGGSGFRTGTKDDANVNYLSATFRVRSEKANTVYWFSQAKDPNDNLLPIVTFKNGSTANADFAKYLRCSVTIDGATNVYSLDDTSTADTYDKTYRTVENNAITTKTGRSLEEYCYYDEAYNDTNPVGYYKDSVNKTGKPNQGGGDNLDGNTVFSVNQYSASNKEGTLKTVTVKVWLECPVNGTAANTVSDVDISSINLDFVSAWAKTRRIYLHDATVDEYDAGLESNHTTTNWLKKDSNARLFWAIKDATEECGYKPFEELTRVGASDWYYVDIPAIYNNAECALFRCNGEWNKGDTHEGESVKYWDKWATTFPNTFHSEVFTVKSHKFGTWDQGTINQITFIDSCKFTDLSLTPKAYLWDSTTVYGDNVNDKVVMNADWPGTDMTRMHATAGNMNLPTYNIFYTSRFDRGVFNDGVDGARNQLQTQDVWFLNGSTYYVKDYFDMATLKWYDSTYVANTIKYTDTVLVNNFNQNGPDHWSHIRMVYYTDETQGTNNHYFMCRAFIKSAGSYKFMIYDGKDGKHYGKPDGWNEWSKDTGASMRDISEHQYQNGYVVDINVSEEDIKQNNNGVFRFFFDPDSHWFIWKKGED